MLLLGSFFYVIAVMQQDIVPMYKMWQKISFLMHWNITTLPEKKKHEQFSDFSYFI